MVCSDGDERRSKPQGSHFSPPVCGSLSLITAAHTHMLAHACINLGVVLKASRRKAGVDAKCNLCAQQYLDYSQNDMELL